MSIKTNTTSLQDLLEQVNALPTAENLDAEISAQETLISEQDAKIAELAQVLAGKAGGGMADRKITKLTITFPDTNSLSLPIFYYTFNSALIEVDIKPGIITVEMDQNTIGVFEYTQPFLVDDINNITSMRISGMNALIIYCTESDATISFEKN